MAEVVVSGLLKRFGSVTAVDHVSFNVKDKEFVVLLGPSGCGKTTTLRMIAGLETPDGGSVHIGGQDVTYVAPRDRNIGMVFERYALYPHLSVFENIGYPLRVRKWHEEAIRKRVGEVADTLRISELLKRRVNQLSGGQMQRVAIGRAIVREAAVFLMDEPISHLDAKLRSHMRGELKRLQREIQSTTILVSHDQLEAMSMADRIAVLNLGVIQQFDTPDHIFNRPSNRFVANFVGEPSMNFLECFVVQQEGRTWLKGNGFRVRVDPAWFSRLKDDGKQRSSLLLGIRPEHIRLHPGQGPEGVELIGGRIYVEEPLGTDIIYDIEIGDKVVRARALADQTKAMNLKMGDEVHVEFKADSIYLFDCVGEDTILQAQFTLQQEVAV